MRNQIHKPDIEQHSTAPDSTRVNGFVGVPGRVLLQDRKTTCCAENPFLSFWRNSSEIEARPGIIQMQFWLFSGGNTALGNCNPRATPAISQRQNGH